jgi:hypothetical protein
MVFLVGLVVVGFYLFIVVNFKAMYSEMPAKRASGGNPAVVKGSVKPVREAVVNRSDRGGDRDRVVPDTSR